MPPPLDDEDILREILIRLRPQPSLLPRASAVCRRWRILLSNPMFLHRFRRHHEKPPLLGFFQGIIGSTRLFLPILDPPDCIPAARFSLPEIGIPYCEQWDFQGCWHGLAVLINQFRRQVVVVDRLTDRRHCMDLPLGLDNDKKLCGWYGGMLCTDREDGHVHGDCFSSPFKLALICNWDTHIFACLYESASRVWGDVVYVASIESINYSRPSVVVGNALYWLLDRGDVLAFDFERQSLRVIEKPADAHITSDQYTFQLLRTRESGLGFAVLSKLTIKKWERKLNCDGVIEWVLLQKNIQLEQLFPRKRLRDITWVLIMGYDEDTNVIVLSTVIGVFMLNLDTMQLKPEKRDGLGFVDYQVAMSAGRLPGNGEIAVLANGDADRKDSIDLSAPLDDENLLREILLCLPPQPSALPRASLICTRWRCIVSNPQFLRRFRKHHRKPPLLGFFAGWDWEGKIPIFTPVLESPDHIPAARFSAPLSRESSDQWDFQGLRHGLAVFINRSRLELVVWEPLTGQQHHLSFPTGIPANETIYAWYAAVLCADDADDGHVHGDCFSSRPFKLSLAVFDKPADFRRAINHWFLRLFRTEDSGLGLAYLARPIIKLWKRESNCDGVVGWVLVQKTIQPEELIPSATCIDYTRIVMVGYDEDTNQIVLSPSIGNFMLQLDSMQISHIIKRDKICYQSLYPYANFYTIGNSPVCIFDKQKYSG
ncbi:hypothetical protein CFC21_085844 [Triticum aestivum]|uniref:F-box domain-containing protein n=2 Tax=Triticum aestivum TaxID=4565 RepID=A0A9R1IDZ6_WHEAT|nr:hypothetical protein CFC21_085844 [Triticum aestivum]